jgi:hypothetical protein
VHGVAAEKRIIFFDFEFLGLKFFVARCRVAGRCFAFLARFRAFNRDNFSWHKLFFFFGRLFFCFFGFVFDFDAAGTIHGAEGTKTTLAQSAFLL